MGGKPLPHMTRLLTLPIALVLLAAPLGLPLAAQTPSRSAPLVLALADLMQKQKLDAVAAQMGEDEFAAVLFFPGVQMLVVSARYTAPVLLREKIIGRNYRDVYLDLASASIPESKLFIEDMGANGLQPRREVDDPFDIVTRGTGAAFLLDGDHRSKKISEDEYDKTYAAADADYEKVLTALLEEARKSS